MYCANTRQTDITGTFTTPATGPSPLTSKDGKQRPALGLRELQPNVSHRRRTREASEPMLLNNQSEKVPQRKLANRRKLKRRKEVKMEIKVNYTEIR